MSGWEESALCAQTDPDLFYPDTSKDGPGAIKAALDICARCPVEYECWWDAVETGDAWGIRGGQKPAELREAVTARHGYVPLAGLGKDWHPEVNGPEAWEARHQAEEKHREDALARYHREMGHDVEEVDAEDADELGIEAA